MSDKLQRIFEKIEPISTGTGARRSAAINVPSRARISELRTGVPVGVRARTNADAHTMKL